MHAPKARHDRAHASTSNWSADGQWLIYTAVVPEGGEGDLDVLAVLAAGGTPITLAGGPGREGEGRWRPR